MSIKIVICTKKLKETIPILQDIKQENIVIDKSSLDMLKGSKIDFASELIGSSFKITNPKTKSSCGCGISFSF